MTTNPYHLLLDITTNPYQLSFYITTNPYQLLLVMGSTCGGGGSRLAAWPRWPRSGSFPGISHSYEHYYQPISTITRHYYEIVSTTLINPYQLLLGTTTKPYQLLQVVGLTCEGAESRLGVSPRWPRSGSSPGTSHYYQPVSTITRQ